MQIKFGCQTYTWQMSIEPDADKLDKIIGVVRGSGFAGIEPEVCMLGRYRHDAAQLAASLQAAGIELGSLCLVCDWLLEKETSAERAEADRAIGLLASHFPNAVLTLCQMPQKDRQDLGMRQRNCLACCNEIGRRARDLGVVTAFHPNSPAGSVFRIAQDYAMMMDGLDGRFVGYAPDAGHIAKGGMDPLAIFTKYAPAIRHVHFKDMDTHGGWTEMGQGSIDFPGLVGALIAHDYRGWVMVEDESPRARMDPDGVTRSNGRYLQVLRNSGPLG